MNILTISGSRNPQGKTAAMVEALLRGARNEGAACECVFLPSLAIERCRQCDENGWGDCRSAGRCVIEDDFAELVEKIRLAEAVAFATPVYFGDLSESMRAFLDRLRRISRHDSAKPGIAGKPAVAVCVAGGGGGGAPFCCESIQKTLSTTGFDVLDVVLARRQNMDLKEKTLALTGAWLARQASAASGRIGFAP